MAATEPFVEPVAAAPPSLLALALPAAGRLRLPLTRDQLILLIAAANQIFLGLDTYLAHSISGTIRPNEWIPIAFGPLAGVLLLLAGLTALRWRGAAMAIAFVTFLASIAVGLLGVWFHWMRAILPTAPPGEMVSVALLVWAPPLLGPLAFAGVAVLGMSAAWLEHPPDSGRMGLGRGWSVNMPFSKTRAYLLLVAVGILAATISSVLDHARTGFHSVWLWIAVAAAIFATVVPVVLAALEAPRRGDALTHLMAMAALIVLGGVGSALHIHANLVGDAIFVAERFIRGAPFMAPLLFANMGLLGIVAMLPPGEGR